MLNFQRSEQQIIVSDLELSKDYYSTIFGIKGTDSKFIDEQKKLALTLVQAVDVSEINPKKLMPEVYGFVSTVEELYSLYLTYRENGALFAFNPRDTYDNGQRAKEFAIRDLDGYIIAFKTITSNSEELNVLHSEMF